jgi:hypothetical protein
MARMPSPTRRCLPTGSPCWPMLPSRRPPSSRRAMVLCVYPRNPRSVRASDPRPPRPQRRDAPAHAAGPRRVAMLRPKSQGPAALAPESRCLGPCCRLQGPGTSVAADASVISFDRLRSSCWPTWMIPARLRGLDLDGRLRSSASSHESTSNIVETAAEGRAATRACTATSPKLVVPPDPRFEPHGPPPASAGPGDTAPNVGSGASRDRWLLMPAVRGPRSGARVAPEGVSHASVAVNRSFDNIMFAN